MKKLFFMILTFCLAGSALAIPKYTYEMTEAHLRVMMEKSCVSPTASCDANLALPGYEVDPIANYVVGTTPGNNPTDSNFPNNSDYKYCPPHNIYAYKISDPNSTEPKVNIVVITGIHGGESAGTWTCQGMEEFFASDEPEAINLRKIADVFVYPLCNPDGRYLTIRGNPELARMIDDGLLPDALNDMNRIWHLDGYGLSTIDALVPAMLADTGGQAEYWFDFHGGNQNGASFIYIVPSLYDSPFVKEFAALHPFVPGESREVAPSVNFRPGDYRMTRVWSMRPAPEGLNVKFGCTPENTGKGTTDDRKNLGRLYGLATYNTLAGNSAKADYQDLRVMSESWLMDDLVQQQPGYLVGQWNFDNNDVNDNSGNGHDGIIYDNPIWLEVDGEFGGLYSFDEVDDYITVPDFDYTNNNDEFSVSFWFKIKDISGSSFQYIFSQGDEGAANNLDIYIREANASNPGTITTRIKLSQGGKWQQNSPFVVADGEWHMYTITVCSQVGTTVYIDSEPVQNNSAIKGSAFNPDTDIYIAAKKSLASDRYYGSPDSNDGLLDDFRIYNYTLSSDDIEQLYAGAEPNEPSQSAFVCAKNPVSDLNKDCIVDYFDFAILASIWLEMPAIEEGILCKEYYSDNVSDYEFIDATWSHNLGGGDNRILLVAVAQEDDSTDDMEVVRITYNNVEMLPVLDSAVIAGYSNKVGTRFYYLLEEDLPEPGFYTVSVTYAGSVLQRLGGSISRSGVVQQAPVCLGTNINTGQDSISSEVTTISDNTWLIDSVASDQRGSFSTTSNGMTEHWDVNGDDGNSSTAGSSKTVDFSGQTTMSWSYSAGANILVHSIIECELLD